ncbi:hypothetical protein [Loktanella salsilacus]|uniref:hypothetical protein n=1 Tax=Loktanella salsilacus TaxID=195913 RepID=UPI003735DD71
MIPQHQRDNYEHTDYLIHEVKHLQSAAYELVGDLEIIPSHRGLMDTVLTLLNIANQKFEALEKARQLEWVGLGGKNETLSENDLNKARGD